VETFKVLEIKKGIFDNNDRRADMLRDELQDEKTFLLNLMSSPGSGKTTTVLKTIELLRDRYRFGIMEADIDSDVDARKVAEVDIPVVQVHTGGMCHLDAEMTRQGLAALPTKDLDIVILENVGNLVCPAEFDTGSTKNAMILSVPEGDDKPLKYPLMFSIVDVLLINKMDAIGFFDFNLEAVVERAKAINHKIQIFPISAKTGAGMEQWTNWLAAEIAAQTSR
jgi:hydrogenase nickel incorporation protein HypB